MTVSSSTCFCDVCKGDMTYGCFQKLGVPQNGWFTMEHPIKIHDLGVPFFFWKHPYIANPDLWKQRPSGYFYLDRLISKFQIVNFRANSETRSSTKICTKGARANILTMLSIWKKYSDSFTPNGGLQGNLPKMSGIQV